MLGQPYTPPTPSMSLSTDDLKSLRKPSLSMRNVNRYPCGNCSNAQVKCLPTNTNICDSCKNTKKVVLDRNYDRLDYATVVYFPVAISPLWVFFDRGSDYPQRRCTFYGIDDSSQKQGVSERGGTHQQIMRESDRYVIDTKCEVVSPDPQDSQNSNIICGDGFQTTMMASFQEIGPNGFGGNGRAKEENLAVLSTSLVLLGFSILPLTTYSLAPNWTHSSTGLEAIIVEYWPYLRSVDEAICTAGTLGMCYIWHRRKGQPNWLVNHLFYPGFLNSVVGVFVGVLVGTESAVARHPSHSVDSSAISTSVIQKFPVLPGLNYPLVIAGLSALVWGTLTCVYGMMGYPSHNYEGPNLGTKCSCNDCKD